MDAKKDLRHARRTEEILRYRENPDPLLLLLGYGVTVVPVLNYALRNDDAGQGGCTDQCFVCSALVREKSLSRTGRFNPWKEPLVPIEDV
jgi:hypothetical protein